MSALRPVNVQVYGALRRWDWLGADFDDLDAGGILMGRSQMWGMPGGISTRPYEIRSESWWVEEGAHHWTPEATTVDGTDNLVGDFQVGINPTERPLMLAPLLECIFATLSRLGDFNAAAVRVTTPLVDSTGAREYLDSWSGWFDFARPSESTSIRITVASDYYSTIGYNGETLPAQPLPEISLPLEDIEVFGYRLAVRDRTRAEITATGTAPEWTGVSLGWLATALATTGTHGDTNARRITVTFVRAST